MMSGQHARVCRAGRRGFTLIELLVALLIFALLAVMSYGGLRSVLNAQQSFEQHNDRLAELQMLFLIMGRDIEQTIDRSIRDIYGDSQAALLGGDAGLELTRGGRGNPAGMARSQLQRVGWVLEDGQLQRLSWAVLDQAPDSVAIRQKMAGQVQRLNLRFLDQQGQWHLQWPESSREEGEPTFLPRVVEVTVELEDWGAVTRLYRIVSSRPSPAKPGP